MPIVNPQKPATRSVVCADVCGSRFSETDGENEPEERPMAAHSGSTHYRPVETDSSAFFKVAAMLLGFAVAVVGFFALLMWADAREANPSQTQAASRPAGDDQATDHNTALPLSSFAGVVPENADALAKAHRAYDAALRPAPVADLVKVQMTLKDMTVEVAPGVKYNTWAFDGHGAPGPVVHVRQGQTVEMTLTNGGAIPHSIDFHAARIAPNVAFRDVLPGDSFTFRFKASDPGVFMYHCGTKPVLAHIANGMYGAIVVDPATPLPKVDNEYVLVASEWYLDGDGIEEPASLDMAKARAMMPDWTTFNGYANQYVTHPLTAEPGETTRFYVVAAGPTLDTNFHVVGTILDRAWVNGDMTKFQRGVQTVGVPAGGGAVFDVKIDEPGLYPLVSHAFAHVDLGQVGLLKVGEAKGTMSH
jgi:nitrite reductase (NO-forming)